MGIKRSVSITGVLLAVVVAAVWSVRASGQTASPVTSMHQHAAPAAQSKSQSVTAQPPKVLGPHKQANLPPLPFGPRDPLPRPPQVVAQVFQFAAEHPEILSYVPCFCGCDHMGHKGNDDCFVKSRAANGDVVAVGAARHRMPGVHRRRPAGDADVFVRRVGPHIRAAVEKKFAGQYQYHTPTPQPPAKLLRPPTTRRLGSRRRHQRDERTLGLRRRRLVGRRRSGMSPMSGRRN